MQILTRNKLLIGITTVAVAAGGGVAYAATQTGGNSRQAFLNDVAKRLNVPPSRLSAALKGALIDRLQAEVKAGAITQAQANRIEQRINQSGRLPLFFGPGGRPEMMRAGVRAGLPAAAHYLGLTPRQLLAELRSGKSLAQIASSRHKPVSGLKQAIISAETTRLNQAVANKRITKQQEQKILSRLSARIDQLVNRTHWGHPPGMPLPPNGPRMAPGLGGGPGPGGPGGAPGLVAPAAPGGPGGPPPPAA